MSISKIVRWGFKSLLACQLLLLGVLAEAAQPTICWNHDGKNTDGSDATLTGFNIYRAATAATIGSGTIVSVMNPAQRCLAMEGVPIGTWYFGVTALSANQNNSGMSNVIQVVVTNDPLPTIPTPPTGVSVIANPVYTLSKQNNRIIMANVGTVPVSTACIKEYFVVTPNGTYYAVPTTAVTWTGNLRPVVVFARCS